MQKTILETNKFIGMGRKLTWFVIWAMAWSMAPPTLSAAPDRIYQAQPLSEVLDLIGERYQVILTYDARRLSQIEIDFEFRREEQLETAINRALSSTNLKYRHLGDKYFVVFREDRASERKIRKIKRKIKQIQQLEQDNELSLHRTTDAPRPILRSVIKAAEELVMEQTITGSVRDAEGFPLVGATVQVKGTAIGTTTDIDGNFSLSAPDDATTLVVSFVGYANVDVEIQRRSVIDVVLSESASILNEVVVVGYGTQGRGRVSAAVSQIDGNELDINKRPVTNVQNSLVGSLPGLIIDQQSGKLGEEIDLRVRAVSALEQKNALVLIDGFEGSLTDVNPSDIASVSVLKDAAATAIYGARSANGVILITTKNTKRGEKLSLTYSTNYSWQQPAQTAELANSVEFIEFSNEAAINEALRNDPSLSPSDVSVPFSEAELSRARSGFYPDTKWVDDLYGENAGQNSHNLTISGGTERVGYFFNVGYLNQNGLVVGSDNLKRFNLRLKVDADITDWLTVGANASNTSLNTDNVPVSEGTAIRGRPFFPIQLEDGTYVDKGAAGGEPNPLGRVQSGSYDKEKKDALNVQLYGQIKPIERLTLEGRVSYLNTNLFREIWNTPYEFALLDLELNQIGQNIPVNGADRELSLRSGRAYTLNTLATARYEVDVNERHHFSLLAGMQTQEGQADTVRADRANFILPSLQDLKLGQTISGLGNTSGRGANRTTLSYFGRLSYDFASKYLVEFNFRADASSNFGPNNKWGYFPAISVGWNAAEEDFLSEARSIDVLKLRASWGRNGDDGSINAIERVNFDPSGAAFGSNVVPSLSLGSAINPDLKWETSEKVNLGLDLVLWRGKLGLTAEYFTDKRSDIITELLTSVEGGLEGVLDNVYDAKSWGWEFELSHENRFGKNGNYFANFNISYYDSEITNTEGVSPLNNSNTNFQDIGLPVFGNWFGYVTEGFFDDQSEIDAYVNADGSPIDQSSVVAQGDEFGRYLGGFKYVDQPTIDTDGDGVPDQKDGVINANDRVVLKTNTGDNLRFGFNLGASYKRFSFSTRLYGVLQGYQWWRSGTNLNPFTGDIAPFVYQMDTWRPDNQNSTFPSVTASNIIPFDQNVSHLIQDNAYVKLKNINVGYSFDPGLIEKFKVSALDVYVSVENLGVLWTNNPAHDTGWDPELETGSFRYPLPLTTSFGLNITF